MTIQTDATNILKSLQKGLNRAIESYNVLISEEIPSDAKNFAAYHNACKAALTHIALATKMSEYLRSQEEPDNTDWLELARETLKTEENNEPIFS